MAEPRTPSAKTEATAQPWPAAARAVDEIISDLTDRRGLSQEWSQIDAPIRRQIRDRWRTIVRRHINACLPEGVQSDGK